jgi:4-amino-4-deoxy-L-arabinose transferase-like glycosyltransferase
MSARGKQPTRDRLFFIVFLAAMTPVLLINLGRVPFIEDEGIRGLVALEMQHSENYISPTLYGQSYLKKPPLWNWVLLASYNLFGTANELTTRIPTILFLLLFTCSIYIFTKRYVEERQAVLTALLFLTCGRILFWDSMLGLIDIMFSWVIFMQFVWIYHYQKNGRLLPLYLGAYTIASIGFMLKALPSVVFLGITLFVAHAYQRTWRNLISWQHLVGIGASVTILGSYLFLYSQFHPVAELLSVFVNESTQRTALTHGYLSMLSQIATFPMEMLYHFLPWSLLSLLLLGRDVRSNLATNSYIVFCALVFLGNILIYWSSPEVYPRYLFMLAPLYFAVCIHLYYQSESIRLRKVLELLLYLVAGIVLAGTFYVFFNMHTQELKGLWWKWALSAIPMSLALFYMVKSKEYKLHSFLLFLLAARLGFSLIVLPVRSSVGIASQTRQDAYRVAQRVGNEPIMIYQHDSLRYEAGFYLTTALGKVLKQTNDIPPETYLLINPTKYATLQGQFAKLDSIRVRRADHYVYIIKGS